MDGFKKTVKMKCGGAVKKKFQLGGSTGPMATDRAVLLGAFPGKINDLERARMAGSMSQAAPAGSTTPGGQKRGGKVKKCR